jgi:hypothetical protein
MAYFPSFSITWFDFAGVDEVLVILKVFCFESSGVGVGIGVGIAD